jgi:hypothetical protein
MVKNKIMKDAMEMEKEQEKAGVATRAFQNSLQELKEWNNADDNHYIYDFKTEAGRKQAVIYKIE